MVVARDPQRAKPDLRVAQIAAGQHGLITRYQALAAGLTAEMIKTRLRNGTFVHILRGVYRLSGTPKTWKQDVLAVVIWGGDKAVASHGTAAKLWSLPVSPVAHEITVPVRRDAPNGNIRIHRGTIASSEVIDAIPVTTPSRTILDVAGRLSADELDVTVDAAITRHLATRAMLEWELGISGGSGRYGSSALRRSLDRLADGHCESPLETKVLRLLLGAGLPVPKRQYEIRANGGVVARVDLAYPAARLAIEVDGFQYHSSRMAFDNDGNRDARLAALDWLVLRATARVTRKPADFIAAVRRRIENPLF